jgi:hypothetical protein
MQEELAPLRRAQELLVAGQTTDDIVKQLRALFGLDFVGAMAAVASVVLLTERGLTIPEERPLWYQAHGT